MGNRTRVQPSRWRPNLFPVTNGAEQALRFVQLKNRMMAATILTATANAADVGLG
jgi:hypothetical protein